METIQELGNGRWLRLDAIADGIVRVRYGTDASAGRAPVPSIAERYGILNAVPDEIGDLARDGDRIRAGALTVGVDNERQRISFTAGDVDNEIALLGWDADVDWHDRADWLRGRLEHWYDRQDHGVFTDQPFESRVPGLSILLCKFL